MYLLTRHYNCALAGSRLRRPHDTHFLHQLTRHSNSTIASLFIYLLTPDSNSPPASSRLHRLHGARFLQPLTAIYMY